MDWTNTTKVVEEIERERAKQIWKSGDELCREAADEAGLRTCAKELRRHGHETTIKQLREWRDTAAAFPLATRRPDLSFEIHAAAGNPKTLDLVLAVLKKVEWPILPDRVAYAAAALRHDGRAADKLFKSAFSQALQPNR